jgi:putative toxin-antitoxin system antitoxin component (TIGR02293 family)
MAKSDVNVGLLIWRAPSWIRVKAELVFGKRGCKFSEMPIDALKTSLDTFPRKADIRPMTTNENVKLEHDTAYEILGGQRVFHGPINTRMDAHEMILRGFPGSVLTRMTTLFNFMRSSENLEKAAGISIRTYQRRKKTASVPLTPEQSSRIWRFAEIFANAVAVLGTKEEAEVWFVKPAIGLDGNRPIDLVATAAGAELLTEYLTRMEYGVYT